jgi:hypothetical protein
MGRALHNGHATAAYNRYDFPSAQIDCRVTGP